MLIISKMLKEVSSLFVQSSLMTRNYYICYLLTSSSFYFENCFIAFGWKLIIYFRKQKILSLHSKGELKLNLNLQLFFAKMNDMSNASGWLILVTNLLILTLTSLSTLRTVKLFLKRPSSFH